MPEPTITQCEQIRAHLLSGEKITPIEALNFYECMRLGARIYDLRAEGISIQRQMKELKNGKKVAEYYLLATEIKRLKNQSINPSEIQ